MPPKTRKVQKKKEMAEVLSLQTELSSGKVDNLKRKIKEELPNHFGDVDVIQIALKRHDGEMNLREDFIIDQKFLTIYDTLLQVIHENIDSKHEINDTIKKVIAQQKIVDKISVSNLFEMKIRESLNKIEVKEIMMVEEDFEKLNPISYLLFECGEKIEAQQMEEVAKWFDDALKLPQGLNIWNIHTDVNYQREIKSANVLLTSGSDIAIGPSRTTCVWVEAKKSTAECEIGQVIGELLLIDNRFALNSMTVLTNCNNFWMILYIIKDDDVNYIVRCSVNCGLALAIIKQFVIEVENQMNKWVGKRIDEMMELMINEISEEELSRIKARKKLRIVRKFCKLDKQLYIDQIISRLNDNYEYLADQYRQISDCENSIMDNSDHFC
ncbi:hypothetical protein C2G38_2192979 [Gigaspora rosea]|uniref:Uncharacterized protein n=1 Tax=Gigaspora rosea TaxID=44941 RepID=A0A397UY83_9GLOM|nr:hypothetical protein C2G38_2192979 [Gigaspora rosea]